MRVTPPAFHDLVSECKATVDHKDALIASLRHDIHDLKCELGEWKCKTSVSEAKLEAVEAKIETYKAKAIAAEARLESSRGDVARIESQHSKKTFEVLGELFTRVAANYSLDLRVAAQRCSRDAAVDDMSKDPPPPAKKLKVASSKCKKNAAGIDAVEAGAAKICLVCKTTGARKYNKRRANTGTTIEFLGQSFKTCTLCHACCVKTHGQWNTSDMEYKYLPQNLFAMTLNERNACPPAEDKALTIARLPCDKKRRKKSETKSETRS